MGEDGATTDSREMAVSSKAMQHSILGATDRLSPNVPNYDAKPADGHVSNKDVGSAEDLVDRSVDDSIEPIGDDLAPPELPNATSTSHSLQVAQDRPGRSVDGIKDEPGQRDMSHESGQHFNDTPIARLIWEAAVPAASEEMRKTYVTTESSIVEKVLWEVDIEDQSLLHVEFSDGRLDLVSFYILLSAVFANLACVERASCAGRSHRLIPSWGPLYLQPGAAALNSLQRVRP